jgi:hypothetical protein
MQRALQVNQKEEGGAQDNEKNTFQLQLTWPLVVECTVPSDNKLDSAVFKKGMQTSWLDESELLKEQCVMV